MQRKHIVYVPKVEIKGKLFFIVSIHTYIYPLTPYTNKKINGKQKHFDNSKTKEIQKKR